jgi:hypothetical protein
MNELDLSAIYAEYERSDGRGLSAYHPLLMTQVLLYRYCIGITRSRRIEPDLKVPIPSPSLSCIPPTSAPLASSLKAKSCMGTGQNYGREQYCSDCR